MADVIAHYCGVRGTWDTIVDRGLDEVTAIAAAEWYNSRNYPDTRFAAVRWVQGNPVELARMGVGDANSQSC